MPKLLSGPYRALLGGGGRFVYTLNERFTTDESGGLASPRNAEPGPGSLTITHDTGNDWSIVASKLHWTGFTANFDPNMWETATRARAVGQALMAVNYVFGTNTGLQVMFNSQANRSTGRRQGVSMFDGDIFAVSFDGSIKAVDTGINGVASTRYDVCIVLRTTGAFHILRTALGDWNLLWVELSALPVICNHRWDCLCRVLSARINQGSYI